MGSIDAVGFSNDNVGEATITVLAEFRGRAQ